MTIRLILLVLVGSTTAALAESPEGTPSAMPAKDRYVVASAVTTDGAFDNDHRGVGVQVAHRFGTTGGFLRAAFAAGRSEDDRGAHAAADGYFEQLRVGVETRGSGRWVRLFGGIDLGLQIDHRERQDTGARMSEVKSTFVAMPRVGIEAGSRVWIRAALGFPTGTQISGPSSDGGSDMIGIDFDLGVGVGF